MKQKAIKLKDIPYGSHERQVFDLFLPEDYNKHGLVLFIHGGSWKGLSKETFAEQMDIAFGDGYACASINYRYISDTCHMDALMEDVDAAVRCICDTAAEYGIVLSGMLMSGASAGAHLCLLYAYTHVNSAAIKPLCVFSFCGPTDLTDREYLRENPYNHASDMAATLSDACGVPFTVETMHLADAKLAAYSPVSYVTPECPMTVLVHGQTDMIVPYSNAVKLRDELMKKHVEQVFINMPCENHNLGNKGARYECEILFRALAKRFLENDGKQQ